MKPMATPLTIEIVQQEAVSFARAESRWPEPSLFGVTDGKAVGTYLEHKFQASYKAVMNMRAAIRPRELTFQRWIWISKSRAFGSLSLHARLKALAKESTVLAIRFSFLFTTRRMIRRRERVCLKSNTLSSFGKSRRRIIR